MVLTGQVQGKVKRSILYVNSMGVGQRAPLLPKFYPKHHVYEGYLLGNTFAVTWHL